MGILIDHFTKIVEVNRTKIEGILNKELLLKQSGISCDTMMTQFGLLSNPYEQDVIT